MSGGGGITFLIEIAAGTAVRSDGDEAVGRGLDPPGETWDSPAGCVRLPCGFAP